MSKEQLKIDVGCGGQGTMWQGFIGLDQWPYPSTPRVPGSAYVNCDFVLSPQLPWAQNTVDVIYCLHVIEHMPREHGVILLQRIKWLLKVGGVAVVTCPDTKLFIEHYILGEKQFFTATYPKNGKDKWPGRTLLDRLFYSMYDGREWGHKCPYDMETLRDAAALAGWCDEEITDMPKGHECNIRPMEEMGLILLKNTDDSTEGEKDAPPPAVGGSLTLF